MWKLVQNLVRRLCGLPPLVEFKFLHEKAQAPRRALKSDAGFDLFCVEGCTIIPGETKNVPIGIAMCPPRGYYFTIDGRSSFYRRGLIPLRGVIDSGYVGPWFVSIMNEGKVAYKIDVGDRVAQTIMHKSEVFELDHVDEFTPTERGSKGFGSSGR